MKQAADALGINYSTAKTIVQTFRREHRIAKKPKRSLETKRAMRRERHLLKALAKSRIAKILSQIISSETSCPDTCLKARDQPHPPPCEVSMSVSTAAVLPPSATSASITNFHRDTSAAQLMLLLNPEKAVPKEMVSIGTNVDTGKKDIFYVFTEDNPEEEYKRKVDYKDPVTLRVKPREEELCTTLHRNKLPAIDRLLSGNLLIMSIYIICSCLFICFFS